MRFLYRVFGYGWIAAAVIVAVGCATDPESRVLRSDVDTGLLAVRFFSLEHTDRSGDSILIRSPGGETMLIDAGVPEAGAQLSGYLRDLGVERIDHAVVTHPHRDHIGGYQALVNKIDIGRMLMIDLSHDTETYRDVMAAVRARDIPIVFAHAGVRFSMAGGVEVEVLNPPSGPLRVDPTQGAAPVNNLSLVLRITYGEKVFLFTGDLYREAERRLLESSRGSLDADVLKVPHHGESTSSSSAFVEAVSPDYAVMTINILQSLPIYRRYERAGALVYVTGIDGTVLMLSDGHTIDVTAARKRPKSLLE